MENETKKQNKVLEFLITTLNGMAYGLFATLIIGTIFGTIGTLFNYGAGNPFCDFMFKVLGNGELKAKIDVEANAFSKSAEAAIQAAGGNATKI